MEISGRVHRKMSMKAAIFLVAISLSSLASASYDLMDEQLAAGAEVVVRAKLLYLEGADKYARFRVRVLKVFKNPLETTLANELSVIAYSWRPGVPEGESTLYLERYDDQRSSVVWKLVGGEACTGVSHNRR